MTGSLLTNVRPWGGAPVDVLIADGQIAQVAPHLRAVPPEVETVDGGARLLLPGLVDAHAHIDKTLWGQPWHPHQAGPRLIDKIEGERKVRRELGLDPAEQSACIAREGIRHGTTHIRTHVDLDTETGLANLQGVLATWPGRGRMVCQAAARGCALWIGDLELGDVAVPEPAIAGRGGWIEIIPSRVRELRGRLLS